MPPCQKRKTVANKNPKGDRKDVVDPTSRIVMDALISQGPSSTTPTTKIKKADANSLDVTCMKSRRNAKVASE
jgi:hypothetical protein